MTLKDIAKTLNVEKDVPELRISGVSTDSRSLQPGMLFVALEGDRFDGHMFIEDVIERKAAGIVHKAGRISEDRSKICFFPVRNTMIALQNIAAAYRNTFEIPVIAVTGTNGKTTTKEMLAQVLGTQFHVEKSIGNYNNHIGVALSICQWSRKAEAAVVEMGTNHFGEIRTLCEIARPTHGVISNIGKGHLEFFNDLEGVTKAKSELLEFLRKDGTAFLNGDDDNLHSCRHIAKKTKTFGFQEICDFQGELISTSSFGEPKFRIEGLDITVPIPGSHNAYNAMAAFAVARELGVPGVQIQHSLQSFKSPEKRMQVFSARGITIINDTYNANPSSVENSLYALCDISMLKRRVAVLGDMLELGESSGIEHTRIGEYLVNLKLDALFVTGSEMKRAYDAVKEAGMQDVYYFADKQLLFESLIEWLQEGDGVLVKGSRGMAMEEIVQALKVSLNNNRDH